MRVKVQKWGNSLALRIPKAFAEEAEVSEGGVVDLSVEDGNLIMVVPWAGKPDHDRPFFGAMARGLSLMLPRPLLGEATTRALSAVPLELAWTAGSIGCPSAWQSYLRAPSTALSAIGLRPAQQGPSHATDRA